MVCEFVWKLSCKEELCWGHCLGLSGARGGCWCSGVWHYTCLGIGALGGVVWGCECKSAASGTQSCAKYRWQFVLRWQELLWKFMDFPWVWHGRTSHLLPVGLCAWPGLLLFAPAAPHPARSWGAQGDPTSLCVARAAWGGFPQR